MLYYPCIASIRTLFSGGMTPESRIRQKFLMRFTVPVVVLFSSSSVFAQTAAETDWQPTEAPGHCQGVYVSPEEDQAGNSADNSTGNDTINASAESILHVVEHSTTLTGNIRLTQEGQELKADFATIDDANETYTAEGNVSFRQPDVLLNGERIEGNLFSGAAAIDSASFVLHQARLRGSAARISRDESGNLAVTDGNFTTCEPGDNTWAIKGRSIALKTGEGYGVARDVTLKMGNLPVAWFPYFRFPIDDRRQSGVLVPSIGQDSDGGTDIAVPYYFNLAPNYDATYTLRSIWKRGIMHEGEFRHLDSNSANAIAGTYLPSDDEYDDRSRIDPSQPEEFSEQDRWLVHLAHRGRYGRWSSNINYTSVSDSDYFRDLGNFTRTDSRFSTRTNHTSSPALLRRGSLSYTGTHFDSSLELRSFQSLNRNRQKQYEVLPRVTVSSGRRLGPVDSAIAVQYTQFDKSGDNAVTGTRAVIDGSLQLPMQRPWGYLNPALRLVHRDYRLEDTTGRDNVGITTTLASIDSGLVFERQTRKFGRNLLQTLEPRLQYLYADEDFQDDLPLFDSTLITPAFDTLYRDNQFTGYDRIGDASRFSLGVTTRFIDSLRGSHLVTASIGQMFHLEDREVGFAAVPGLDSEAETSPLFAEISSQFGRVSLRTAIEFDSDAGRSNRGLVALRYRGSQGKIINFNYRMTHEDLQRDGQHRNREESDISFFWPVSKRWNLVGRWNYGWDNGQTIESLLGVEYNDCCWKARIVFRRNLDEPRLLSLTAPGTTPQLVLDRRADSGIFFEFQLKGLASLGGRLDSLLEDTVPGYSIER
jgi:LPS-assembly protein